MRADASTGIGVGHVMRSMALAQAWQQDGGVAFFAAAEMPAPLAQRLVSSGLRVEEVAGQPGSADDLHHTVALASANGAGCVVADGYAFGATWQRGVKDAGLALVVIDDYGHAGPYCADVVLNQNLAADSALYREREPGTRLLLGSPYTLLRSEFTTFRGETRGVPSAGRRILVTLGGSDPENVTLEVVRALATITGPALEVRILAGGSYPHLAELKSALAAAPDTWEIVVDSAQMPEQMRWADLAISAAGSTSWELAFMQVPMILIVAAENQREIGRRLAEAGAAVNLGPLETLRGTAIAEAVTALLPDHERRRRMVENGRAVCDGHGAERVVAAIRELCS